MGCKTKNRIGQRGQVLLEGIFLMLFLTSVLIVMMSFTKNQQGILKRYELPAKIHFQKNR
jgi:hypothetical protein